MATIELNRDNLDETIKENDLVLIDFWAPWCGPCRVFKPVFEKAAEKHPGVVFAKVNTEEQPELAQMFGIQAIPTLVVFREKIGIFSQAGALPAAALDNLIEQAQALDMEEVRREVAAETGKADATGQPN